MYDFQIPDLAIGDYRRAIRYLLTPLYYLSLLHSIVARIDLRRHLSEAENANTHKDKDSIPLTSTGAGAGEMSTIHIDPKRGKEVVIIEARSRGGPTEPVRPPSHPPLISDHVIWWLIE